MNTITLTAFGAPNSFARHLQHNPGTGVFITQKATAALRALERAEFAEAVHLLRAAEDEYRQAVEDSAALAGDALAPCLSLRDIEAATGRPFESPESAIRWLSNVFRP